ncbi:hypothetical protein RF11_08701 [Thelohanellus kitauei]|uniref:Uncharacterized protein n=1 Tax=Thelohanellus kitauei TaxID=669202 RepID=A0A0C2MWP8_THEKT|nr:hypothetical protein RF11_08701 [Thelohanellus kitauei]
MDPTQRSISTQQTVPFSDDFIAPTYVEEAAHDGVTQSPSTLLEPEANTLTSNELLRMPIPHDLEPPSECAHEAHGQPPKTLAREAEAICLDLLVLILRRNRLLEHWEHPQRPKT